MKTNEPYSKYYILYSKQIAIGFTICFALLEIYIYNIFSIISNVIECLA